MKVYEDMASSALGELDLKTAAVNLDTIAQRAAAEDWSYTEFLGRLLEGEVRHRQEMRVALSLQFARFPYPKRLGEFDFKAQPGVDRRLIDELATGRFLAEGRNIVFLGPPGVGKTHLAIGLGVMTAELGHRVYFTTAVDIARKLVRAMHENRLSREIKNLTRPKLLIIDEVGYLKLEPPEASLLFQVISERYERKGAVILTSNKAFAAWGEVFAGDAVMASAALDRLLHRSTVINIRGESYRPRKSGPPRRHGVVEELAAIAANSSTTPDNND
ncbi:MAG: ATP-binding protein [Acidobacteria bacterium]|nr:ATP-binding protein [Acidobacteriota bacterium]